MKQRHLTKKISSLVLAAAMIVASFPVDSIEVQAVEVQAAEVHNSAHSGWTEWNTADAMPDTAGNYYLTTDVTLSSGQWTVPEGTTNLCLNSCTIKQTGAYRVISVPDGATLNLYDEGNNGKITGGNPPKDSENGRGGGILVEGACTMYGGQVTGNNMIGYNNVGGGGGGIAVNGGTFTMEGGSICNNSVKQFHGGGITVINRGEVIMNGGTITGNTAGNNDSESSWGKRSGGGVYIDNNSSFTMSGGEISGNTAYNSGGGVNVDGTFTMSGGRITGNTAKTTGNDGGGGIGCFGKVILSGGTISGNKAIHGGGVLYSHWSSTNPGLTISGNPVITDNTNSDASAVDNLYLETGSSKYITIDSTGLKAGAKIGVKINQTLSGSTCGTSKALTYTCDNYSEYFVSDVAGYAVGYKDNKICLMSAPHNYSYTADDDQDIITRTCSECGSAETVTLSIPDDANLSYTGSAVTPAIVTCSDNWAGDKPEITYENNIDIGTAVAKITFGGETVSLNFNITVEEISGVTASGYTGAYDGTAHGISVSAPEGTTVKYGISSGNCTQNTSPTRTDVGTTTVYYEVTKPNCKTVTGSAQITISAPSTGVTLHPNGGTGGTDLTSYTFGTGAVLSTDWTKTGYTFAGWYDNENLTGDKVTEISNTAFGDKEYWAKWTDDIAPVIGTLTYNYQPNNLWQWLIGKDSLVITVPVTEEGSGADKITYTLTPDGGTAREETANIQNGEAEITVSADFKGTISIVCTDKANNTSASVTVGADAASNGIIIEDNAPEIAFQAKNAELQQTTGEYKTAPDITVTVADNKDNAISGGIASVSYKIGNGSAKAIAHDYTTGMIVNDSFTIPASEIPAGETEITVTATDNGGNSVTQNYTVKVHTHSGTLVPEVEPTCTTAGNTAYYTCSCGQEFSNSGCTDEITDHTKVIKNALGHDFTGDYQFGTEAHWKKCSRCDATDSREAHSFAEGSNHCTKCEFEKAGEGHTHTGELHERVEPTCTTKGNTAYYTCDCGQWFSDSSCTKEITDKSKIEIAALEHDFVMKQDQNEHWRQCSRCSLEQSRGPHEYDDASDTDCNVCGYVRTVQHTHSGTLVPAVEPTCTEDGHEAYYTCSCGKWFSDSGCVNKIADHTKVIKNALGHDFSGEYQSDKNGHWKVCSRCNVAQTAENHVFDDDNDTDCNQCGYLRNIGNQGNVSKDVEKDEKAPDTVLSDSAEELVDTILTEEEKGQIGSGTDVKFILDVKDAGDTISGGDKTAVQQTLDGNAAVKGRSVGQYLDISLFKVVGDTRSAISETARKLTIVIHVPDSLKSKDGAKPRTYAIIRVHDGTAEVLEDLDGDADTITIATDRFSTYALVYKEAGSGADVTPTPTPGGSDQPTPTPGGGDQPTSTPGGSDKPSPTPGGSDEPTPTPGGSDKPSPTPGGKDNVTPAPSPSEKPEKASGKEKRKIEIHSGLKAIQTGKKLQVSWGRVTGADGYSVYVQYCGKDFSAKSLNQVKSGKKTKITVKKVNGKKLDTTKNFKLYVVAWKWENGKKSTLAKTLTIHVAGKDSVKYTNVKSIQVKKSSYTLKKGGTVTLHPKAVLYDKRKKQLSVAHCKEFRYLSSNKKVATVTAGGKVKAKGTGECTIYVFAKNGCRRKIKIKVKK